MRIAVLLATLLASLTILSDAKQPNIILFVTDDQSPIAGENYPGTEEVTYDPSPHSFLTPPNAVRNSPNTTRASHAQTKPSAL